MAGYSEKKYVKREVLGTLVYPIVLFLFIIIFSRFGWISSNVRESLNWFVVIQVGAGVVTFYGTFYFIKNPNKIKRKIRKVLK